MSKAFPIYVDEEILKDIGATALVAAMSDNHPDIRELITKVIATDPSDPESLIWTKEDVIMDGQPDLTNDDIMFIMSALHVALVHYPRKDNSERVHEVIKTLRGILNSR